MEWVVNPRGVLASGGIDYIALKNKACFLASIDDLICSLFAVTRSYVVPAELLVNNARYAKRKWVYQSSCTSVLYPSC